MRQNRKPGEDIEDHEDQSLIDLSALDRDFSRVSAWRTPIPIPDGRYHVEVERVDLTRARTSHRPIITWKLRILGHPFFEGRMLYKNNLLSSTDNLRWLKHDLCLCGLELEKLSDLPVYLDRLIRLQLEVTKRTKGDFNNVYFERCIRPLETEDNQPPPF